MHVVTIVNNNNVVYEKKYYGILINEKHFIFGVRFNFNLMNVIKRCFYYNIDNHLRL